MTLRVRLLLLCGLFSACDGPRVGVHTGAAGGGTAATYQGITTGLMAPRCATSACHGGASPVAFPSCDADRWYDAMVGVDSQQAAGMPMIAPGDPENSYLVLKLRGTHGLVGGGMRMPIADTPLDDEEQAAVEAWITNGAPR